MPSNLPLAARVISEGFLPARSSLLHGPSDPVGGPVPPDRIRGMLLGLAIGDALSNTSEGMTPAHRASVHGEIGDYLPIRRADACRVGLPSDDTQLAFWTLESLLEFGDLDPEDVAKKFTGHQIFGIGSAVRQFLANRADGVTPWYRCGVESAGNGALMRVAPIVLLHPAGTSVALADLLARLLRMPDPPAPDWIIATFLNTVRQVCTDQRYQPRRGRFADWEGPFPDYLDHVLGEARQHGCSTRDACDAWCSGAYLLETVPSVLWILTKHAHDPEEAIIRAVNDTDDNDTVAAIVGAAVDALHGDAALPTRWRSGLLGRTQATDNGQVFRLVEAAVRREWG